MKFRFFSVGLAHQGGCLFCDRPRGWSLLWMLKELAMTQAELNDAVAKATGESPATIATLGFGMADPEIVDFDPEPYFRPPLVVDWDALDARREVANA
jgi:hypothetical protein